MTRKKKSADKQRKNELTKGIFSVLEAQPNATFNYKQIAAKLNIIDAKSRKNL